MKKVMFVALAFFLLAPWVLQGQDTTSQDSTKPATTPEKQGKSTGNHTKTVTGCLQKGHEAGEFSITGEDGKAWDLTSKSVKLDEHVGHQVTVTGSARRESKAEEKAEEKKEGQMEKARQARKNTVTCV